MMFKSLVVFDLLCWCKWLCDSVMCFIGKNLILFALKNKTEFCNTTKESEL